MTPVTLHPARDLVARLVMDIAPRARTFAELAEMAEAFRQQLDARRFEVDVEWWEPGPTFTVDRYGGIYSMTVDTTPRPWWKLLVLRPWWRWQAWRFDRRTA